MLRKYVFFFGVFLFSFNVIVSQEVEKINLTNIFDSTRKEEPLPFLLKPRKNNFLFNENLNINVVDLEDPSLIEKKVYYDHSSQRYIVSENVSGIEYRRPSYLSRTKYLNVHAKNNDMNYFKSRVGADMFITDKSLSLNITAKDYFFYTITGLAKQGTDVIKNSGFDRQIAGLRKELQLDKIKKKTRQTYKEYKGLYTETKKISKRRPDSIATWLFSRLFDFNVSGYIEFLGGVDINSTNNPVIPDRARSQVTPIVDFQIDLNADVKIGNKIAIPFVFANIPNFNNLYWGGFGNAIRNQTFSYNGNEDQIIQYIQLGKINFKSKNSLVENMEDMWGVKTKLKFGRLTLTSAYAQHNGTTKTIVLDKGGNVKQVNIRADEYEHNKHFFLAQTFRNKYNNALKDITAVRSNFRITRVEIWVTNRNANYENARQIIALSDLGESSPSNKILNTNNAIDPLYADNGSNDLYANLVNNNPLRSANDAVHYMEGLGLQTAVDFEKIYAKKIPENNYTFHPTLGYISLDINLLADDVLSIAYEYTYNGKTFKVGEFSNDISIDTLNNLPKILYTKMLKSTIVNPTLPIWDLMMKNIYRINTSGFSNEGFNIYVAYKEPGEGEKIYIPNSNSPQTPILQLVNSDNINTVGVPSKDGKFDFVEKLTIDSKRGRIIFPVLEPFSTDLAYIYSSEEKARENLFYELYDSIQSRAQQNLLQNRFYLKGYLRSSVSQDIFLGAFNIPQGSVVVRQGGNNLVEGFDYIVDYTLGSMKITNPSIVNSGIPITIEFQENAFLGIVNKRFIGARLDYKVSRRLSIGGVVMNMRERPYFTKVNMGQDPINNTLYGFDVSFNNRSLFLNKLLDKLPFYTSTDVSNISFRGEFASLVPGHNDLIRQAGEGVVYIDDFENSSGNILLNYSVINKWGFASTPRNAFDGITELFPEAKNNDISYNYNRAKIAWYQIDPTLQQSTNPALNPALNSNLLDPRWGAIARNEIFPNQFLGITQNFITTFDVAYIPSERGPYNFNTSPTDFNDDGTFTNPKDRWGGIQRSIEQPNFEDNNIEFIEFWVQDPFIVNPNNSGNLYINLGNVSEDVLKDGKLFYENGVPTPSNAFEIDTSTWGIVPKNPVAATSSFTAVGGERSIQDAGLDGLTDKAESGFFASYLNGLATNFGLFSEIYLEAATDPSGDNFLHYRFTGHIPSLSILGRYLDFNNPQGNSAEASAGSTLSAATLSPDKEDNNNDNTLTTDESYYQYKINLTKDMNIGTNYIIDKRTIRRNVLVSGGAEQNLPIDWYLFRIPIKQYQNKVGAINDFKSIRFIRMYLRGFTDTVVLRFAKFALVKNTWRRYEFELDTMANPTPIPFDQLSSNFIVSPLSLEENDQRYPIPYVIPPGIQRQQQFTRTQNIFLNEQSLSLRAKNIKKGKSYNIFKKFPYDLRRYEQIKMFVHAEKINEFDDIADDDVSLTFRFGNDYTKNFFEVAVPLKLTSWGQTGYKDYEIWREENNLDFYLSTLTKLKIERENSGLTNGELYSKTINGKTYSIYGKPNMAEVLGYMIGIKNRSQKNDVSVEVWINELRVAGFNENASYAVNTKITYKLSDLGTLTQYGSYKTAGFGGVQQKIDARSLENTYELGSSTNLELGKLTPKELNLSIPTYAYIDYKNTTPLYDPFEKDLPLEDRIRLEPISAKKNNLKSRAVESIFTRSININKMRILPNKNSPKFWSARNLYVSFGFTQIDRSKPLIEENTTRNHYYELGYNYNFRTYYFYPFRKIVTNTLLAPISKININFIPSNINFTWKIERYFESFRARNIFNSDSKLPTFFDKRIAFNRNFNYSWKPTKSISLSYRINSYSLIDEPEGRINTREKNDSIFSNIFNGGRLVNYKHSLNGSYNLPIRYFPYMDWVTVNVRYSSSYEWISAFPTPRSLAFGNTIKNSMLYEIRSQFNFKGLYLKSPTLRKYLRPTSSNRMSFGKKATQQKQQPQQKPTAFLLKVLLMAKNLRVTYSRKFTTTVPGFMPRPSLAGLGVEVDRMAPGYNFVFGYQPDKQWLQKIGENNWLSKDPNFNTNFEQTYSENYSGNLQLEPMDELTINLELRYKFSKNNAVLNKWLDNGFQLVNEVSSGNLEMTSIFVLTHFTKTDPKSITLFKTFNDTRQVLSERIGKQNPLSFQLGDSYYYGYDEFSQDVLIPSFIATYQKRDPSKITLLNNQNQKITDNPFRGIFPLPNWSANYTGLSKLLHIEKIIPRIVLNHRYVSKLNISQFKSNLRFRDSLITGVPSFIDTVSGNFIPYYLVPNVTISESFSPLAGISISTPINLTFGAKYITDRKLSLSLVNFQISETKTNTWNFNFLWTILNIKPLFKIKVLQRRNQKKQQTPFKSSISFRVNFTYSKDVTNTNFFEQEQKIQTGGNITTTISPSITYNATKNVTAKFYYEFKSNTNILTSLRNNFHRVALQVRINLAL